MCAYSVEYSEDQGRMGAYATREREKRECGKERERERWEGGGERGEEYISSSARVIVNAGVHFLS
jgi:hypothetical protein